MKEATLRVYDTTGETPSEWVYENAQIHEGPLEVSSRLKNDGTIEIGSLEVRLLASFFVGLPDVFSLPRYYSEGHERAGEQVRYRAVVELTEEDGSTAAIFDGTIRKSGVSTDAEDGRGQREWSVEVESTALSDVMDELADTNIYDYDLLDAYDTGDRFGGAIWSSVETAWPGHRDSSESDLGSESLRWYPLPDLWRVLVGTLPDVEYAQGPTRQKETIVLFPRPGGGVATPHVISLESLYENADGEYLFEHTLPLWTGKELLDVIQGITGMRLDARYQAYPSRVVELREIEGAWRETNLPLPVLDRRASEDVYDLTTEEPNEPDFALWYDGEGDDELGTYAAYNYRPFEGGDGERRPRNESTQSIPVSLAEHRNVALSEGTFEGQDYAPYVGVPVVEEEGAYLSAFHFEVSLTYPARAVAYRALPGYPPHLRNEVWLREHLHRHPLSGAMLHQAAGRFDVEGVDIGAGLLEDGFTLEGRDWLVRDIRNSKDEEAAKIEGVRVVESYDPAPPDLEYFAAPTNLQGESFVPVPNEIWLDLSWRKPPLTLTPRFYLLEVLDPGGNLVTGYDLWDNRLGRPEGASSLSFVRSDPTGLNLRNRGNGLYIGDPDEAAGWTLRLRAQYEVAGGWTSPWVSIPFPTD